MNCALKLVNEIILYYDARSKKKNTRIVERRLAGLFLNTSECGLKYRVQYNDAEKLF